MAKKKAARKSASKSSKSKVKARQAKAPARRLASKKAAPAVKAKAKGGKPVKGAAGKNAKPNGKTVAAAGAKKPSRVRVRICKAENCQLPQTTQGYCRLHYLANWKALREEKLKRAQKNLDRYVERMAGAKKPAQEEGEETEGGQQEKSDAVFEEDFGEFVDVLSREENLDKILNGIKVEDY